MSGLWEVCICSFYVGDMWGLYLFFLSGVWGGKGEGGERSGEEEKSNNPNLKGGEKQNDTKTLRSHVKFSKNNMDNYQIWHRI